MFIVVRNPDREVSPAVLGNAAYVHETREAAEREAVTYAGVIRDCEWIIFEAVARVRKGALRDPAVTESLPREPEPLAPELAASIAEHETRMAAAEWLALRAPGAPAGVGGAAPRAEAA